MLGRGLGSNSGGSNLVRERTWYPSSEPSTSGGSGNQEPDSTLLFYLVRMGENQDQLLDTMRQLIESHHAMLAKQDDSCKSKNSASQQGNKGSNTTGHNRSGSSS